MKNEELFSKSWKNLVHFLYIYQKNRIFASSLRPKRKRKPKPRGGTLYIERRYLRFVLDTWESGNSLTVVICKATDDVHCVCGTFLSIYISRGLQRCSFWRPSNARAIKCGTSNWFDSHAFLYISRSRFINHPDKGAVWKEATNTYGESVALYNIEFFSSNAE